MRLPAPLIIIFAFLLCCTLCRPANSQTSPAKKNPDATVSGKVIIKGKPAPGVVVGLRSSQPAQGDPTFKAITDQEGNYRITEVPGGIYEVAPVAPALVIVDLNYSTGQTVIITEGEHVEGVDFDLARGGVVTGKITDADGHPIIEERVFLLPADPRNQRGSSYNGAVNFQTDDRGIYRIFGIRPGRYKVSVGEGNGAFYRGAGRGRPSYPTTFYPDVTDVAKAAVVAIDEGTEATGIDISLSPIGQGFSVNGQVLDGETGKPLANMGIGLSKIEVVDGNSTRSYGGGVSARSDSQGEFRLEKLPPGKYSLIIYPPPDSDLFAAPLVFDVLDQDVTGLLIKASMGASLSGTVILEGTKDNKLAAALAQAYVYVNVRNDAANSSSGRSVQITPDGTFRMSVAQAGLANFSLGNAKGLIVLRVERNGVVQPNGIQIQNAEKVSGVLLVVAYRNGSIRGVVKTENGTLPPSRRLIIQLSKAGEPNQNLQVTDGDARGHFLIQGLAAGSYELTVIAYVPESGERTSQTKQLVTVTDGEATEVTVTIDLPAPRNP